MLARPSGFVAGATDFFQKVASLKKDARRDALAADGNFRGCFLLLLIPSPWAAKPLFIKKGRWWGASFESSETQST